jgi:hypothetical protein
MTADSWKSLIIKILLMILTPLAAQLHLSMGPTDLAAIAADLADLAVLAYGVYRSSGMKLVPHASVAIEKPAEVVTNMIKGDQATVTGKIVGALLVALALSLLALPQGASAVTLTGNAQADLAAARAAKAKPAVQSPTDVLTKIMNDISKVKAEVIDGTVADIKAADADAATLLNSTDSGSFKDPIAHACYPAEIKFLQSLPSAAAPTGSYVLVQLFQRKRDFVAQLQAGIPAYLKLGCSALLGDEVQILTKSLALVGVTVGANMLLPGSGIFTMPPLF